MMAKNQFPYEYPEDSGIQLFRRREFDHYFVSENLRRIIDNILYHPSYYLIEAGVGAGKTALVAHLAKVAPQYYNNVLLYVFTSDHFMPANISVEDARRSLSQQVENYIALLVSKITEEQIRQNIQPTANTESTSRSEPLADRIWYLAKLLSDAATLGIVEQKRAKLLILIDALNECDKANLSQFLPEDRLKENVTIVLTTRQPKINTFENLYESHPLAHVKPTSVVPFSETSTIPLDIICCYRLGDFSNQDITKKVREHAPETVSEDDLSRIVQTIFEQSRNNFFYMRRVLTLVETFKGDIAQLLEEIQQVPRTNPQLWYGELSKMSVDPGEEDLRDQLLALLAVARSSLSLDDIVEILDLPSQRTAIYRLLSRNSHIMALEETQFGLPHNCREYLREHPLYGFLMRSAQPQFLKWVCKYLRAGEALHTPIPKHLLEHAAEYLINDSDLQLLFGKQEWFNAFERLAARRAALVRARDAATAQPYDQHRCQRQVVNLLSCYLIVASFSARLGPQDILQLVAWGKLKREQAIDYAQTYIEDYARQEVLKGLDVAETLEPYPPFTSRQLEKIDRLPEIERFPEERRIYAYNKWLLDFERARLDPELKEYEQEQFEGLMGLLGLPYSGLQEEHAGNFKQDYEQLSKLPSSPVNQRLSRDYERKLHRVVEQWQHAPTDEFAFTRLQRILSLFSSASREQLLELFSILASGLSKHYPDAREEIRTMIEQIVRTYP